MKIAVFDYQLNNGGGKRFLLNLLCALTELDPHLELTLFCAINSGSASFNFEELTKRGIKVQALTSLQRTKTQLSLFSRAIGYGARKLKLYTFKEPDVQEELSKEISARSKDFDLAYFPWPYLLKSPITSCPKIGTFHDFNFKYFFGTLIYNQEQLSFLNESFEEWFKDTTPVVSTYFMKRELQYFYPHVHNVEVVHLASLNLYQGAAMPLNDSFKYDSLLDKPYIVFPVHLTVHKNLGNVIAATSLVNKEQTRFRLVLTGGHTEIIKGKSDYLGLRNNLDTDSDVLGLGYISDSQMHYLLQNSFAVINASLYEAGNGVGLDAWSMGIPVLQSSIPAFEEHLQVQGFKAFTFDPRDASSIAEAIEDCLSNSEKRMEYVKESINAAKRVNWENTATEYLRLFKTLAP